MNKYIFSEIEIGQTAEFEKTVSAADMAAFLSLSGDNNPMHVDESFAKNSGFDGMVVYGMLTASLMSTMAGVHLPGENCLLLETSAQFANPVYVGDTLTVSGKVTAKDERFSQIQVKVVIRNQDGKKVLGGNYIAKVLK